MKKTVCIFAALLLCLLFSACCLKHDFRSASCTEPETCVKCGETRGEALGHEWSVATCLQPEHCARCGLTRGEALGHDWEYPTLERGKTCTRCGEEERGKLEMVTTQIPREEGYDCWSNGVRVAKFRKLERNRETSFELIVTDPNGPDTKKEYSASGFPWSYIAGYRYPLVYIVCAEENASLHVIDWNNKEIGCYLLDLPKTTDYYRMEYVTPDVLKLTEKNYSLGELYFDLSTGRPLSGKPLSPEKISDHGTWIVAQDEESCGLQLCGNPEGTRWGYLNRDNELVEFYDDATSFTGSGFALVSGEGGYYDLIDSEFHVIKEGVIAGVSASQMNDAFLVTDGHGVVTVVTVK